MFKKNKLKASAGGPVPDVLANRIENNNQTNQQNQQKSNGGVKGTELVFHCQLAHGSPTVFVSGFSNVKELYARIAQQFEFPESEILFCTLNTYKTDMKNLLAGQIGLEDFIFAHKKGRPKEVELTKDETALGLTITDNGAGYAFIKRIKEGSVISKIPHIQVGDHIEKLDGELMIGKRHHEVARILKAIPMGSTFMMRLVEPIRTGFTTIQPKSNKKIGKSMGTGRETLRFKAGGNAEVEEKDEMMELAIEKLNSTMETFLGINDSELATQIWDIAEGKQNSMEFAYAIDNSDLQEFGFDDDMIIELWGVITDARSGRLQ